MMRFRIFAFAILAASTAMWAKAEGPAAACPADADVQVYQASEKLEWVIQQEDLNRDAGTVIGLANACPSRPFVQYFAARSYFYILRKLGDPNAQLQFLTGATNALRAYDMTAPEDRVWTPDLKNEDGSDVTVNTLSGAKSMLAVDLVPLIVRFEAGGMFHEFVSYEGRKPGNPCPWQTPDLAVAEAAGYPDGFALISEFYYENGQLPNIRGAIERIEFLKTACPAAEMGLTSSLGKLYYDTARGARSVGMVEAAGDYAVLAIPEYESYRTMAEAEKVAPARISATVIMIKDMQRLVDDAAASE